MTEEYKSALQRLNKANTIEELARLERSLERIYNAGFLTVSEEGSDTFGHIIEACDLGNANSSERSGPLRIPNLIRWGLGEAAIASRGKPLPIDRVDPEGAFGFAKEISAGKDTPSGHWEICGLPVPFERRTTKEGILLFKLPKP